MDALLHFLTVPPEVLTGLAAFILLVLIWDRLSGINNRLATTRRDDISMILQELRESLAIEKQENDELRQRVTELEARVDQLVRENHRLRRLIAQLGGPLED